MARVKISELPETLSIDDSAYLPIVQDGVTQKIKQSNYYAAYTDVASDVDTDADRAETAADDAEQSATEAAASANTAQAEASAWSSETTYSAGGVCYGTDYISYRSKVGGNKGNDPVTDTTNTYWAQTLGANISETAGANKVPKADSSGRLENDWLRDEDKLLRDWTNALLAGTAAGSEQDWEVADIYDVTLTESQFWWANWGGAFDRTVRQRVEL